MNKILRIILVIIAVIVLLAVLAIMGLITLMDYRKSHYYENTASAGGIEKKYTAMGPCQVSSVAFDAGNDLWEKYEIWYPSEMMDGGESFPVVVMVNGTGMKASKYEEVFRHLASWGFIVIGNEDENARTGASSAATLDFILQLNEDGDSGFCGRVDMDRIGIAGHSQGGVGALNAATMWPNGTIYRAIFTASATSGYWGQDEVFGAEWRYDMTKVNIPCFMVAGTGAFDAGTAEDIIAVEGQGICPLWSMTENYESISDSVSKAMARRDGADHGDMLYYADGYMTAWFMYWLKRDAQAGEAFFGENAEILSNTNWQDVRVNP